MASISVYGSVSKCQISNLWNMSEKQQMRTFSVYVAVGILSWVGSAMSAELPPPTPKQSIERTDSWKDFHSKINKTMGNSAISPDILNSTNPHVKPYAAIVNAAKWNTNNIFVCWENPSPAYAQAMEWVRDAVTQTWQKYSALKFNGWTACLTSTKGVRIRIADDGPHVTTLGRLLSDVKNNRMVLNFTFHNWSQSCQGKRESCIRSIAVHEFGHAIGLTHEQNRPDTPGECATLAQGTSPNNLLTPYDPDSVMNYCNKDWNNDGLLSLLDIEGLQELYGKPQP